MKKTEQKKVAYKTDIFAVMAALDGPRDYSLWNKWTADEQSGIAPLIIMRWMTGTSSKKQILMMNEFVNPFVFSLAKHQELMIQLLHLSSDHRVKRYYWQPVKGTSAKNKERDRLLMEYYGWSSRELAQTKIFTDAEELVKMAEDIGWQQDDIAKLKKELKG